MWTRSVGASSLKANYLYTNTSGGALIEENFPLAIQNMAIFSLWFQPSVGLFKVLKIMTNP
jgi:hypothetical protein